MCYSKKIIEQVTNRKQRLVLKDHRLSWADIKAGVTQGLVLGPVCVFFYFLYINNVTQIQSFLNSTKNEVFH